MHRLIRFELGKIWRKRSFLFSVFVLLVLNLFLLWYTNRPNEYTPALSAYQKLQAQISIMSEAEKADYMAELKETIDGVSFVQEVLSMRNMGGEMGAAMAESAMTQNPGVFETYYDQYRSGEYLRFTPAFSQEKALIDELYDEQVKVAGYGDYLRSVRESKESLNGISIFGGQKEASYSSRNIEKSAADHAALSSNGIRWMPSKAITSTMESVWTDLLLLLSIFLFMGSLITEEKEKRLFYITRPTKYGIRHSILAKLLALLAHCFVLAALFFGANYLFFACTAGGYGLTASIQSIAPYMESSLSISILGYLLLSVLTKGLVLFGIGAVLTALCLHSGKVIMPYLAGFALCGISWALYCFIPAVSPLRGAKYLNIVGLLKTENLYGAYLNFDVFGYPVSRLLVSWIVIGLLILTGSAASYVLFTTGRSLQLRQSAKRVMLRFKPHGDLLRHESYKILIMNRALAVLLLFGIFLGYGAFNRKYTPSAQEQYYQDIMLRLEGAPTEEKNALFKAEQARYQEAFDQLAKIDEMAANGEISQEVGDTMRSKWYSTTAFYPAFQRVEQQHTRVTEVGGYYLYDTGYLYLFGLMDEGYLTDFLLLSLCLILAFSSVISMEYQSGSWNLLCATAKGRRRIIRNKILVCAMGAATVAIVPFVCRIISISAVYPLHGLSFSAQSLPFCQGFGRNLSVGGLAALLALSQIAAAWINTILVVFFSRWRKDSIQALFFGVLILAVPIVLKLLGFDFAQWISTYPLYAWPRLFCRV